MRILSISVIMGTMTLKKNGWAVHSYITDFWVIDERPVITLLCCKLQMRLNNNTLAPNMELKVWVEGIQRIVCGVTDATTCQVNKPQNCLKRALFISLYCCRMLCTHWRMQLVNRVDLHLLKGGETMKDNWHPQKIHWK